METQGLRGGVIYHDGQFDDSRLVINLAQTAVEQGGVVLNYMKVIRLVKKHDIVSGVIVYDVENDREYEVSARAVINATGVFSDRIRKMDDSSSQAFLRPSQGVHIVVDKSFLPGDTAIMVPHTDDGRVLFAIPWNSRVLVGTTDTPVKEVSMEPIPLEEEIGFLLQHAAKYLTKDPVASDVLSVFAGLRPLVSKTESLETATISREHTISISRTGLVTIAGGKWTTYRKMAEETIDQAIEIARLDYQPPVTRHLQIHGYHNHAEKFGHLEVYGSDAVEIKAMEKNQPKLGKTLPDSDVLKAEVAWAVQKEMARTVEDFLARRRRILYLDARSALGMAPEVAKLMAAHLKKGRSWQKQQIKSFQKTADLFIIN